MTRQISDADINLVNDKASDIHASRLRNLAAWQAEGTNPYAVTRFRRSHAAAALKQQYEALPAGEVTTDEVTMAGRIMAIRNSGMFIVLDDTTDRIQLFNPVKELSPAQQVRLQRLDLGDIIGVAGRVRRTPRGELTIDAAPDGIVLIAKSLEPLPEKHHGLTDPELESRERHKSISTDAEVKNRLVARSKIITAMRQVLLEDHYLEVETPTLHPIAGGAVAAPFSTHFNALDFDFFLRIAPELYLKRLIASGISDRVFEIGRNFRNEGMSYKHNPEFTSIEAYAAYANFEDMIDLTEKLVAAAVAALPGQAGTTVRYNDTDIDFKTPWRRAGMVELVREYTGVDFDAIADAAGARAAAQQLGVGVKPTDSWGHAVEAVFGDKVESQLIQPVHVTSLPAEISPLAKPNPANPRYAERFESYVAGREIANAFSELNDPFLQHAAFKAQALRRTTGDAEATLPDDSYVKVLEYGLPATGGLGIGVDRLIMLLTNAKHIREVILFPALRPEVSPVSSVSALLDPL